MRWISVLSALVVAIGLYLFVMERDTLQTVAGVEPAAMSQEDVAQDMDRASDYTVGPVSVVVQRSSAQDVPNGLVVRGRTEAERHVDVLAETTGRVISAPLRRGAQVAEGALLCRLDPGSRPSELAEAEARFKEAEANSLASERLSERGYTAETTAIANRAALQAAQAAIEQTKLELERLNIHAPFAGLLEDDAAELGALLQPGSLCATVIDLDPIKLVGFVSEGMVDRVAVGAPVRGRLINGRNVEGEVTFVSRSADPETRTFRVEAEIANPDLSIRDGLTAEIQVSLEGTRAHLLPQSALTLDDLGRLGVRVVEDNTARFLPVEVIRDTADGILLTGLPEQVDVIVIGQDFVIDGQSVKPSYTGDPT
jgi:membrane fusion protein, multidrug efflux system